MERFGVSSRWSRRTAGVVVLLGSLVVGGARTRGRDFGEAPGDAVQGGVDLRRPAQRRRLVAGPRQGPAVRAEGARRQGQDDVQGERRRGAAGRAGGREPRPRRQQDHLRDLVRLPRRSSRAKYPDVQFEQATGTDRRRTWPSTSARARTRSTSPAWPPARRRRRATIGYVVPFAIPEVIRHANAFALGAQATHPRRQGEARLDELVVRPGQGEEGGREPVTSAGADVHRPERRQPGGRASTPSRRASRGSATTRTRRSSRRSRG